MNSLRLLRVATLTALLVPGLLRAWDAPGHRIINQLALEGLPADFPAFVREPAAVEQIAFLAGLPDRWSHALDPVLKHDEWPNHYLDVEQLADAGLDPATVPSFRYDFMMAFAQGRAAHPDKFPPIDPVTDIEHTRQWPGFLPWTVTESYGKVKAAFSALKVYLELGTPAEVANAEAEAVHEMATMGHYVGDLSQPLHTTIHHDGWVGPNPHNYPAALTFPVALGFHTWIDSGLIRKARIKTADLESQVTPVQPLSLALRADGRDPVFVAVMEYMMEQHKLVEPLYQLEREHKLGRGDRPVSPEGRALIEGQLAKGGRFLGALWLTAWKSAQPEPYLRSVLLRRQVSATPTPSHP